MNRITLKNVSIDFPILDGRRSFRKALLSVPLGAGRIQRETGGTIRQEAGKKGVIVRALEDISFTVKEGDRFGLIGHNGSGKSTLLRTIAGVYEPVIGTVDVVGKLSPMFNTSIGMDPEDTGYENLKTIGMYLGLNPKEIRERTEEVVKFCELGDFMHLPVRTYSSGMTTRLGFAIATSIEPDILLLDEWLGAGDARFVEKAAKRVEELVDKSSVLILASHSDALIQRNCNKAILLNHGSIIAQGDVDDVIKEYNELTISTKK